ncbi:MAG: hypothetical protein E7527_03330 [Ruminococcaceae bacterium]|nr:hypothetical protein [Oscillospiraceae bacterium]
MAQTGQAYDLELFRPREHRLVEVKNTKKMEEDARRRNHRQSVLNFVVYLGIALAVLALVGYFITCNVRLTELNKQIADGEAQLSALQSEEVRLNSELAGLTSAERVNQYVQEQGMLPISSSQIYYIEAPQQDQVSVAQEEKGFLEEAWDAVVDFFS